MIQEEELERERYREQSCYADGAAAVVVGEEKGDGKRQRLEWSQSTESAASWGENGGNNWPLSGGRSSLPYGVGVRDEQEHQQLLTGDSRSSSLKQGGNAKRDGVRLGVNNGTIMNDSRYVLL